MFNGLTAGSGPAAVQAVATFLQRVGEVEAGRAEGINRTVGRMVTTLLAQRGLDAVAQRREDVVHGDLDELAGRGVGDEPAGVCRHSGAVP